MTGGGSVFMAEEKVSCWSGKLIVRDWHNLRGKRLYNQPSTVRGFFHIILGEVFFKNILRIFCVDKIFNSTFPFSGEKGHEPWKSKFWTLRKILFTQSNQ
jgi:hypothetical protein